MIKTFRDVRAKEIREKGQSPPCACASARVALGPSPAPQTHPSRCLLVISAAEEKKRARRAAAKVSGIPWLSSSCVQLTLTHTHSTHTQPARCTGQAAQEGGRGREQGRGRGTHHRASVAHSGGALRHRSPHSFRVLLLHQVLTPRRLCLGLRSLRYWKEIEGLGSIVVNDIDAAAVEAIKRVSAGKGTAGPLWTHASTLNAISLHPISSN